MTGAYHLAAAQARANAALPNLTNLARHHATAQRAVAATGQFLAGAVRRAREAGVAVDDIARAAGIPVEEILRSGDRST